MSLGDIIFMATLAIPIVFLFWPFIYRFIFLPWRPADFHHRHWEYWFEKDMVAYSKLAGIRFRFEVSRYGYYKDSLRRVKDRHYFEPGIIEPEVQIAYKQHVDSKFEEIILK